MTRALSVRRFRYARHPRVSRATAVGTPRSTAARWSRWVVVSDLVVAVAPAGWRRRARARSLHAMRAKPARCCAGPTDDARGSAAVCRHAATGRRQLPGVPPGSDPAQPISARAGAREDRHPPPWRGATGTPGVSALRCPRHPRRASRVADGGPGLHVLPPHSGRARLSLPGVARAARARGGARAL